MNKIEQVTEVIMITENEIRQAVDFLLREKHWR